MSFDKSLCPTLQHSKDRVIFGFDIETYGDNNEFLCAAFYRESDGASWWFRTKTETIDFIKSTVMTGAFVFATNLGFDFHGLFENTPEWNKFMLCMRNGTLISATTYRCHGKLCCDRRHKHGDSKIVFCDTMNYCPMGVEKLGNLLGIQKMSKPAFLGSIPKNEDEWHELQTYNRRDAEVSAKAAKFFHDSFVKMGATPKLTIASTAMSVFRNKYLTERYACIDPETLKVLFDGYYGARTEAFGRGKIDNYEYYDINSLYPYVMKNNVFPDINTLRVQHRDDTEVIKSYEGMSDILIEVPNMPYPPLPCRGENKLLFPYGSFRGIYTHVEIREALKRGCIIKKVFASWYCTKTCRPFTDFVADIYASRLLKKSKCDITEIVDKLVMNSLYGKFGQRFTDMEEVINADDLTLEQCNGNVTVLEKDRWVKVVNPEAKPAVFCIPMWAAYVTAYGRCELLRWIEQCDPVYVDTDSLITKKKLPTASDLGALKKEMSIKTGIIVRPKMYALISDDKKEIIKIKGVGKIKDYSAFYKIVEDGCADIVRFARFKEALRRGLHQNQILRIRKELGLNDDKRCWKQKFDPDVYEHSAPPCMQHVNGVNVRVS